MYKIRLSDICVVSHERYNRSIDLDDVTIDTPSKPKYEIRNNQLVIHYGANLVSEKWLKPCFHQCKSVAELKIKCDMLGVKVVSSNRQ